MGPDLNRIASDAKNAWPVLDLSDVDNAELNGHANLLGRQTDSVRFVHRFQHILSERTDPGGYLVDPFSLGPQRGMPVLHDFKKHGVHYGATRRLINFNEFLFLFLGLGESRDILDACISQGVEGPDNHAERGFAIRLHCDGPGRRLLAQGPERIRKVLERDGLFVQGNLAGAFDAQYRGLRIFGWGLLGRSGFGKIYLELRLVLPKGRGDDEKDQQDREDVYERDNDDRWGAPLANVKPHETASTTGVAPGG